MLTGMYSPKHAYRSGDVSTIRSLVHATGIDVLPLDRRVQRRDGYWCVESPSNPDHWWGNFLLFDEPPVSGDGHRWEDCFEREFAGNPAVRHRVFAWDGPSGERGAAATEFPEPYTLDVSVGLIARAGEIAPHPRANDDAIVRALDPEAGHDEELWEAVLDVQSAQMVVEGWAADQDPAELRRFQKARMADLRTLFCAGRGAWYVALLDGEVAGSLGIVVTEGRARYQAVDTLERFRGRGIATRLVAQAAQQAAERQPIAHYVIVADPDYHAIGIYESLGFRRDETACGVQLPPR
jgi:ribosomal protein S18 acetylase RimI-like enzyme